MIDDEVWRPIVGYEEYYHVSNHGNIKSIRRGRLMKLNPDTHGYPLIQLCLNGKVKAKKVHTLVVEAFIGPIKECVDHIDSNRSNNHLSNLRPCTYRQNTNYALKNKYPGTYFDPNTERWWAAAYINGKNKKLGAFSTQEEAANAYKNKILELENNDGK